ncbi:MAG TPA: polyamine ABC transporter ATP-binding protein [Lachnoclostridium sp.]|uniref:ABC transporter ATP-binding protein n=1 Tax=Lacrimispora sp. TaxID=2719234 RepID=UPI000EBBC594|nr:ABC transporter ATP-binding protein [Lacrimispora sp.]HCD43332.1 polyamine ABC transporter ATP-binding protein [Lachnoclostridium sp.]
MSHAVIIKQAVKKYGDFTALNGVDLEMKPGEFFTLLGPSGCGKTTLLRMIAGFNSVDGGEICFDDRVINNLDAHKRDIGMVFQNYAIFPHLTVAENVAYGLKAKKYPKDQISRKVEEALDLVQIKNLKDRKPNELSGGQQQRVALARAFVIEPGVLLMDEPLSNLDAKLRVQMRTVIKKLQRRLGITTIYVTHDQEEALAISDRIAVMKEGNIMQVGSPEEIYKKPGNTFVAGFIGVSNFIECEVDGSVPDRAVLNIKDECSLTCRLKSAYKGKGIISARPEQLFFDEREGLPGRIVISTFLGDFIEYEIQLNNGLSIQLNEYTKDASDLRPDGQEVRVNFDISAVGVYNAQTQEVISW